MKKRMLETQGLLRVKEHVKTERKHSKGEITLEEEELNSQNIDTAFTFLKKSKHTGNR